MIQAGRKGAWIRVAVRSGWTMDILKVSSTGFPDGLVLGNVTLLTLSLFFCLKDKTGMETQCGLSITASY